MSACKWRRSSPAPDGPIANDWQHWHVSVYVSTWTNSMATDWDTFCNNRVWWHWIPKVWIVKTQVNRRSSNHQWRRNNNWKNETKKLEQRDCTVVEYMNVQWIVDQKETSIQRRMLMWQEQIKKFIVKPTKKGGRLKWNAASLKSQRHRQHHHFYISYDFDTWPICKKVVRRFIVLVLQQNVK